MPSTTVVLCIAALYMFDTFNVEVVSKHPELFIIRMEALLTSLGIHGLEVEVTSISFTHLPSQEKVTCLASKAITTDANTHIWLEDLGRHGLH